MSIDSATHLNARGRQHEGILDNYAKQFVIGDMVDSVCEGHNMMSQKELHILTFTNLNHSR